MNDADLGENIGQQSRGVDGADHHTRGGTVIQNDEVHLDPTRWWFASAAFPMIAGTLGPVASAFSICALVKNWRQEILPGSDVTKAVFIPDPPWLYAVNGIQLFIAILANIFLLLNMAKRVRFIVAQPVTIVGWYISSICLIALCATAGGPLILKPEINYVWSQAFWYGLFAAVLYFIVASLMVVTVWGAEAGHYDKDFELTMSQRTLMLQTILFLMYLLIGALVFSHIEGWSYLDAVYWADVTLFTVGFGDFSPQTTLGRGLLMPYALIGVTSFGLVIGSIRSLVLDRGKRRLDARMMEKKRRQLIQRLTKKGKGELLVPIRDGEELDSFPESKGAEGPQTEFERRQREFQLMRKIQDQTSMRRRWTAMAVSTTTWLVLWLVGSKIFQVSEAPYQGWTYFNGIYFSFTALTTIGYGDLTPVSNASKAFFVFWSLLALPTLTVFISNAGDTVVKGIRDGTLKLGNITILPGEGSFRSEMKQLLSRLSCGILFDDDDEVEESPPGFLGAAQNRRDEEDESEERDQTFKNANDPEKGHSDSSTPTKKSETEHRGRKSPNDREQTHPSKRARSQARENLPIHLPKSRAKYHLMLIDEIRRVTRHLQHSPPRKYTFKEWAWYLRLIGEDENNSATHRKPAKNPRAKEAYTDFPGQHGQGGQTQNPASGTKKIEEKPPPDSGVHDEGTADSEAAPRLKWSWVGHRSPLMDTQEEAQWILDKLEERLNQELLEAVEKQDGKAGVQEVKREERENETKGLGPTPLE
ncbi:hypothetical protein F5Y15DRAFT_392254 [Xylariaceae sp. FL0016]|nr:hypothetical protein F5Y15DRAFT_392254 [Xylariaceae sp. FL0016]